MLRTRASFSPRQHKKENDARDEQWEPSAVSTFSNAGAENARSIVTKKVATEKLPAWPMPMDRRATNIEESKVVINIVVVIATP